MVDPVEKPNGELLDEFLMNCRRRYLRPATVQAYRDRLSTFVKHIDNLPIATVKKNTIEEWLDAHSQCAQSRHSYRSTLVQWFDWLIVENDQPLVNTARLTARPRVPKGRPRPLPTRDVAEAIGQASPRMRVVLCLAAYGGLRCGEIAKLRASDVDVAAGWLNIRDGKGGRSRTVPIHPELAAALDGLPMAARGPVVPTANGDGFRARAISNMIRRHLARHDIEGSGHRFRHWFATAAAEAGADLHTIKELLGHSSVATTEIYVGWHTQRGQAAVDGIPKAG